MPDKEKVMNALERCEPYGLCVDDSCPYFRVAACLEKLRQDALALLKDEEERYVDMVRSWLAEIATNNAAAREEILYIDAIMNIRSRAKTGLKQYFIDKQKGQC